MIIGVNNSSPSPAPTSANHESALVIHKTIKQVQKGVPMNFSVPAVIVFLLFLLGACAERSDPTVAPETGRDTTVVPARNDNISHIGDIVLTQDVLYVVTEGAEVELIALNSETLVEQWRIELEPRKPAGNKMRARMAISGELCVIAISTFDPPPEKLQGISSEWSSTAAFKYLILAKDGTAELKESIDLERGQHDIRDVAISPDGTQMVWSPNNILLRSPVKKFAPSVLMDVAAYSITAIEWLGPDVVAIGTLEGHIHVISAVDGKTLWSVEGHFGAVFDMAFGHGVLASVGSDRKAKVWDAVSGEVLASMSVGNTRAMAVCMLSDETLAIGTGLMEGKLIIWNWKDGKHTELLTEYVAIYDLEAATDGSSLVATLSDVVGGEKYIEKTSIRKYPLQVGRLVE